MGALHSLLAYGLEDDSLVLTLFLDSEGLLRHRIAYPQELDWRIRKQCAYVLPSAFVNIYCIDNLSTLEEVTARKKDLYRLVWHTLNYYVAECRLIHDSCCHPLAASGLFEMVLTSETRCAKTDNEVFARRVSR